MITLDDPEFVADNPPLNPLPPDPEDQNDDRAEWAETALVAFQERTRTDAGDALSDLLGDLHHWADRHGGDWQAQLNRADGHYIDETLAEDNGPTEPLFASVPVPGPPCYKCRHPHCEPVDRVMPDHDMDTVGRLRPCWECPQCGNCDPCDTQP